MIEMMFLKVQMLICQVYPNNVFFVTNDIFYKGFRYKLTVCNGCQHVLMISRTLTVWQF